MYKIVILLLALLWIVTSCNQRNDFKIIEKPKTTLQKKDSTEFKKWHLRDIELDTIPGISMQRAYESLLVYKKSKKVIVAILDSEFDLNHTKLKSYKWKNTGEIPNNGLDDDNNGYIDDIHGWNFLGNKQGENSEFVHRDETRLIKKYQAYFYGRNISELNKKDSLTYLEYSKIKLEHKKLVEYNKERKRQEFTNDSLYPLANQGILRI